MKTGHLLGNSIINQVGRWVVVKPEWEDYSPGGNCCCNRSRICIWHRNPCYYNYVYSAVGKYLGREQIVFDVDTVQEFYLWRRAKLGAGIILAGIDAAAVKAARHNAGINRITGCFEADQETFGQCAWEGTLDCSNIISDAIVHYLPSFQTTPGGIFMFRHHCRPGG